MRRRFPSLRALQPDETAATIFDVDFDRLSSAGTTVLLFDLDGTLGRGRPDRLAPPVDALFERLTAMGFRIGILSNRRTRRGPIVASLNGRFPTVFRAGKPARRAFHRILSEMNALPDDAVMIGDRRLTDVLGARRVGIRSILVGKV